MININSIVTNTKYFGDISVIFWSAIQWYFFKRLPYPDDSSNSSWSRWPRKVRQVNVKLRFSVSRLKRSCAPGRPTLRHFKPWARHIQPRTTASPWMTHRKKTVSACWEGGSGENEAKTVSWRQFQQMTQTTATSRKSSTTSGSPR